MRRLGRNADQWNEFAEVKEFRSYVERIHRRHVERHLLPDVKNSELRALLFIISRTLGWQKFAEAIPKSHFQRGLVDGDFALMLDEDRTALCTGSGLSKEDTIRSACSVLERRNIITIFPGRPGTMQPANVYMPFHEISLSRLLIEAGAKVLPPCAPIFVPGEHILAHDGIWRVAQVSKTKLLAMDMALGDRQTEYVELPVDECEHIGLDFWNEYQRQKNRGHVRL